MVKSSVSSKRPNGAMSVVGTGVLVGLLLSASALTQASAVTGQSAYADSSSGGSAGSVQVRFITPPNFSGAVSAIFAASLASVKPAVIAAVLVPPTAAPGPSARVLAELIPPAVNPQRILVAAPPVVPGINVQAQSPAAAPSVAVLAVPEPSTIALLLGGFIALIAVRRMRAVSTKKG